MTALRPFLVALAAALLAAACGGGPGGNHVLHLHNQGRTADATTCVARQFRWVELAGAGGTYHALLNVVVAQGQTTDLGVDLPADGGYELRVLARVLTGEATPQRIRWLSVPMQVGGATEVVLLTGDDGYLPHSTAAGLPADDADVTCTNL